MSLSCSLHSHPQGYRLFCSDWAQMPLASPYALRHIELANSSKISTTARWGHRIIAFIEFIPLLGIFASLVERIVVLALRRFQGGLAAQKEAAKTLIAFCRNIPGAPLHQGLGELELAMKLREWLKTDPSIASLSKLELTEQGLSAIPPEIQYFKELTYLDVSFNRLTSLPLEIAHLTKLKQIFLNSNQFVELPKVICSLANLWVLSVSYNQLTSLPPEIKNLSLLGEIYMNHNAVDSLPHEVGQLAQLSHFSCSFNRLKSIPKEFGQLTNLEGCEFAGNCISSFPAEIQGLTNLESLNARFNPLSSIAEFDRLPANCKVYLHPGGLPTSLLKQARNQPHRFPNIP